MAANAVAEVEGGFDAASQLVCYRSTVLRAGKLRLFRQGLQNSMMLDTVTDLRSEIHRLRSGGEPQGGLDQGLQDQNNALLTTVAELRAKLQRLEAEPDGGAARPLHPE